jgi:hydroxypyruvate isomerase
LDRQAQEGRQLSRGPSARSQSLVNVNGRNEPTTGEINYAGVFAHLHRRGYAGILGMEHGNSRPGAAGEQAVIAAYRAVDPK